MEMLSYMLYTPPAYCVISFQCLTCAVLQTTEQKASFLRQSKCCIAYWWSGCIKKLITVLTFLWNQ